MLPQARSRVPTAGRSAAESAPPWPRWTRRAVPFRATFKRSTATTDEHRHQVRLGMTTGGAIAPRRRISRPSVAAAKLGAGPGGRRESRKAGPVVDGATRPAAMRGGPVQRRAAVGDAPVAKLQADSRPFLCRPDGSRLCENSTRSLGDSTNGLGRHCSTKHRLNDFIRLLRRPVESAVLSGHSMRTTILKPLPMSRAPDLEPSLKPDPFVLLEPRYRDSTTPAVACHPHPIWSRL